MIKTKVNSPQSTLSNQTYLKRFPVMDLPPSAVRPKMMTTIRYTETNCPIKFQLKPASQPASQPSEHILTAKTVMRRRMLVSTLHPQLVMKKDYERIVR